MTKKNKKIGKRKEKKVSLTTPNGNKITMCYYNGEIDNRIILEKEVSEEIGMIQFHPNEKAGCYIIYQKVKSRKKGIEFENKECGYHCDKGVCNLEGIYTHRCQPNTNYVHPADYLINVVNKTYKK